MGPHAYHDPRPTGQDRDMEQAAPTAPTTTWPSLSLDLDTRNFPIALPISPTGSFSLARPTLAKLHKKPLVRWAGLAVALGAAVWVLYPYFLALGLFLDRRPGGRVGGSPSMVFPDVVDVGVPLDAGAAGGGHEKSPPFGLGGPTFVGMDRPDWEGRREKVKAAYRHALAGYMDLAFPNDELAPLTGTYTNKFNGWGVSLIDSLDTMWIMGLHDEFDQAMEHVSKMNFTMSQGHQYIPFFETTIRYLGGLLSAYALSNRTVLLSRADDLGQRLLPAFSGTKSGLPSYSVHLTTGQAHWGWGGARVLFAEATSCQLEFKYLAKMTGRAKYYNMAEGVMSLVYAANVTHGLFPEHWDASTGEPIGDHITAGAGVDSGYEYILKQYLLTGDIKARDQYITSANGIIDNLIYISPKRSLLYATDLKGGSPTHTYEHLTCFLPGMLALGAHMVDMDPEVKKKHEWAAKGLAYTCYVSYVDQTSGLGPDVLLMKKGRKWVDVLRDWEESKKSGLEEVASVPPGLGEPRRERTRSPEQKVAKRDYANLYKGYMLRPETVESLFYLWKTTGDERWRERAWEIFVAVEERCKTEFGYASVSSVDDEPFRNNNEMPSWFLAETLKYFYLLFDDTNPISFNNWVFNTEAHPLPVFNWTSWEKRVYGITY